MSIQVFSIFRTLVFTMKQQETEGSSQCHRYTDERRVIISQSHRHGDSAQEGTQGIAQIECSLNAATTQHFTTLAVLHNEKLLWRTYTEKAGTTDKHHRCRYPTYIRQKEGSQQGCGSQKLQIAGKAARLEPVCQQGTHLVSYHHSQTGKNHQYRNTCRMETAIHLQKRRNVTEPAENTAVAQESSSDDKPGSQMAHKPELRLHTLVRQSLYIRNPLVNHIERDDAQRHRHEKRHSPGDGMTQEGAQRNTQQIGKRHTGTHHRHRLGTLPLLCHLHRHDGSRTEIGTMRKSLDEAGTKQKAVTRGYRSDDGSQNH